MNLYQFTDYAKEAHEVYADELFVDTHGNLCFYADDRLVYVVKSDAWVHVELVDDPEKE